MYKNDLQEETWVKSDIWEERGGGICGKGDDSKDPSTTWHESV